MNADGEDSSSGLEEIIQCLFVLDLYTDVKVNIKQTNKSTQNHFLKLHPDPCVFTSVFLLAKGEDRQRNLKLLLKMPVME